MGYGELSGESVLIFGSAGALAGRNKRERGRDGECDDYSFDNWSALMEWKQLMMPLVKIVL